MSLVEFLKKSSISDTGLAAEIPDAWTQGRTGYGGLTSALCLAAAGRLAEGRPLRSALIGFVGPSAGLVTVAAEKLRAGRTATSVKARLTSGKGVGVEALFTFSESRASALDHAAPPAPAEAPGPDAAPLVFPEGAPEFTRQLEFVWAGGAAPFSGAAEPHELAWVRHRDSASRDHPLGLLCLADALPPAVSPLLSGFAPLSSMTWMIDMLDDAPRTKDGWWLLEARADQAAGGHSTQDMTIWNAEGRCVAKGRQMVTVFG